MSQEIKSLIKYIATRGEQLWIDIDYAMVAEVLDVPEEVIWKNNFELSPPERCLISVFDVEDEYILLHYFKSRVTGSENRNILSTRGIIINSKTKKIVCRSYGYPFEERYVSSEGDEIRTTNKVFSSKNYTVEPYFQGTVIRVWCDGDKIGISSHTKIDISSSKWGESKYFKEMFFEMVDYAIWNNPLNVNIRSELIQDRLKERFFKGEDINYTWVFSLVSPSLSTSSLMEIGSGFVLFLNKFLTGHVNDPKPVEIDSIGLVSSNNLYTQIYGISKFENFSEAKDILEFGYGKKSKKFKSEFNFLEQSDAVMIKDSKGFYMKVYPPSVEWRNKIVKGSISDSFSRFLGLAYGNKDKFKEIRCIPFNLANIDLNRFLSAIVSREDDSVKNLFEKNKNLKSDVKNVKLREKYLAMLMIIAAPPSYKQKVLYLLQELSRRK